MKNDNTKRLTLTSNISRQYEVFPSSKESSCPSPALLTQTSTPPRSGSDLIVSNIAKMSSSFVTSHLTALRDPRSPLSSSAIICNRKKTSLNVIHSLKALKTIRVMNHLFVLNAILFH